MAPSSDLIYDSYNKRQTQIFRWRVAENMEDVKKQVLQHIEYCDKIFDYYNDKEYAYQQVRLLALELLEEIEGSLDDT